MITFQNNSNMFTIEYSDTCLIKITEIPLVKKLFDQKYSNSHIRREDKNVNINISDQTYYHLFNIHLLDNFKFHGFRLEEPF